MANPTADIPALRELLRRSVLTMFAVPDPDRHFRSGLRTAWPEFVRQTRDAYGSAPPRVKLFQPTRYDLTVYLEALSWLACYQRTYGRQTVDLFIWWCRGAAMWDLQERVSTNRRRPCSPTTVRNRMNAMILAVAVQFPESTRKCVDNLAEVAKFPGAHSEGAGLSSDVRNLPQSPKSWTSGAPVPLSLTEQAAAHVALEKQLRRNGSRALKRAAKTPG
jgi:hypothetical protein